LAKLVDIHRVHASGRRKLVHVPKVVLQQAPNLRSGQVVESDIHTADNRIRIA
jgi:hypothetical protein